jgi:hypothetical protein
LKLTVKKACSPRNGKLAVKKKLTQRNWKLAVKKVKKLAHREIEN